MELLCQADRVAERNEVPAVNCVGVDAEPVSGEAALEFGWEETVAGSDHHLDRDGRPLLEGAWLSERRIGWFTRRSGVHQHRPGPRRQIVQEMSFDVELTVASRRLVRGTAGGARAGGIEPLARRFPSNRGDHRVEEHDHPHGSADHGSGERGQRLGDQHNIARVADRLVDDLCVFRQADDRVVLGDVYGDRAVPSALQLGHQ
jgi:hypothetical protein